MRKKEKVVSAYMTLELSLLFPMILTVLICVIYLFFYSYNQTVAFQNAAISALYGKGFAYTDTESSVLTQKMYDVLERLNKNQYLSMKSLKQTVEINKNDIKVSQTGDMVMPLLHNEIISKFRFEEKVVLDLQDSVFYIRQVRKVKKDGNRNNQ